jgi:hypothetical protein
VYARLYELQFGQDLSQADRPERFAAPPPVPSQP